MRKRGAWAATICGTCLVALALFLATHRATDGGRGRAPPGRANAPDSPSASGLVGTAQQDDDPHRDSSIGPGAPPHGITIAGVVEAGAASPRPTACSVRVVDVTTLATISDIGVDANGHFEACVQPPSSDSCTLLIVASGSLGAEYWTSHPSPVDIVQGRSSYFVRLKLLPGCHITARVVDGDGRAVPDALCLLTQLSWSTLHRSVPSAEMDALRTLDEHIRANSSGEVSAIVREGHFELRASADGCAYGTPVRILAPLGGELDVGMLRVPAHVVTLTLRVTGPDAQPLERIWVRLADRALRFGNRGSGNEVAHFFTDRAGRVAFPIDAALLPLRGALGSHEFSCKEVVWTERAPDVDVELSPRPHIDVVVRSPTGDVIPIDVDWFVQRVDGDQPAKPETVSPLDVLRMHCDGYDRKQTRPGTCRVTVPAPGRFRFSADVPGGLHLTAEGLVGRDAEVSVIPEGFRGLTLAFRNAPERDVAIQVCALREPSDAGPFTSGVVVRSGSDEVACWIPDDADEVIVDCEELSGHWSFAGIRSLSRIEIDLAAQDSNCTLKFDTGPDAGGSGFFVRMPTGKIQRIVSDREGLSHLRLKPGTYEVAEPTTDGTPSWHRFVIHGTGTSVIAVRASR